MEGFFIFCLSEMSAAKESVNYFEKVCPLFPSFGEWRSDNVCGVVCGLGRV